jgi:hypothetical protein
MNEFSIVEASMDEYGSYRNTKEDAKEIKEAIEAHGTIVIPYSGDGGGAVILLMSTNFRKPYGAVMPFGGNPDFRIYVGVYGRGCGHFSMEPTHWSYFNEKLTLGECESKWLEELWKNLWEVRGE